MAKEAFRSEMEQLVANGALLVDVRETDESGEANLPGRTHAPLSRLREWAGRQRLDRPIIFYCRSGLLSFHAAEMAANWTEQPVYYLSGGLLGYADA